MAEDVATLSGQRCTQPSVISGGELVTWGTLAKIGAHGNLVLG